MSIEPEETRRARLSSVLADLDAAGQGTFMDLCDLVRMFAERTTMMIKWNHPLALVHVKHKKAGAR